MIGALTPHPGDDLLAHVGDAEQAAETIVAMAIFREMDDVAMIDDHAAERFKKAVRELFGALRVVRLTIAEDREARAEVST